jgi:hypothetical protein
MDPISVQLNANDLFAILDKDGNGVLDKAEFSTFLGKKSTTDTPTPALFASACFPIDSNDLPVGAPHAAASVLSRASVSPSKSVCLAVVTITPLD